MIPSFYDRFGAWRELGPVFCCPIILLDYLQTSTDRGLVREEHSPFDESMLDFDQLPRKTETTLLR